MLIHLIENVKNRNIQSFQFYCILKEGDGGIIFKKAGESNCKKNLFSKNDVIKEIVHSIKFKY